MGFDSRKKRLKNEDSGVSEVVGNIMILMITVVLFTSIIGFVNQIPIPEQVKKASFSASVDFLTGGTSADLSVTHMGGQSLLTADTVVLIQIDGSSSGYYLDTDPGMGGAESWSTGMTWTTQLVNTSYTSSIVVNIIDMEKSQAIWTSQVTGGGSGSPPSVLQRYTDANPVTPTADPISEFKNFSLFVQVTDPDNDLDNSQVYVDSSQFEDGIGDHDDGSEKDWNPSYPPLNGWFRWDFTVWHMNTTTKGYLMYDSEILDGAVIWIYATDLAGHTTTSTFILSLLELPTDTQFNTEYIEIHQETGESGLPSYIKWISGNQGFAVFGENITDGVLTGKANLSDARTVFYKDENVFIRVASLTMSNIFAENKMEVVDTRTGLTYSPPGADSDVFYPYPTGSSAFVYETKFNTIYLPPGSYSFQISLRSQPVTGETETVFQTMQIITVLQEGSTINEGDMPSVHLYADSGYTQLWGETRDDPFVITGSTYMMYVLVTVLDAQISPAPVTEEVRIVDMKGGSQLYGIPPVTPLMTAMTKATEKAYKFSVDLRFNNGDQWLTGINSYTLYISRFSDTNEGVYSLSSQVFVRASLVRADFLAGTAGVYSSQGGSQNFVAPDYLYYIQNNNFFTTRVLYNYPNAPSTTPDYTVTALAAGDIDGDGDKDILMGQAESGALLYFENTLNSFGVWQSAASIARPSTDTTTVVEWLAIADINDDGDNDFAYSSSGNRVVIYNNTYGVSPWIYKTYTVDIRKIALEDMTGDGRADLVVLAGGKIYVYDIKKYVPGQTVDLISKLPNTNSSFAGGTGIRDFDIADMNFDGMLDILTVGDAGNIAGVPDVRGVWVNHYSNNPSPDMKYLNPLASGYNPLVANGSLGDPPFDSVSNTQDYSNNYLRLMEDPTGDDGRVNVTMQFQSLTTSLDQVLSIRARINASLESNNEIFYVSYSTDTNGTTGRFLFLGAIDDGVWTTYTWRLPSAVAGKAIYLRFSDSLTARGPTQDYIDVDYVYIASNIYGGYAAYSQSRYQVVGNTPAYITVRAANIDGDEADGHLETVVAKNGYWRAYELSTPIPGWLNATSGATTFFVECSAKTDGAPFASIAPTLFDVYDVNGDTFDDILTANYTVDDAFTSKIGIFYNMFPAKVYYSIKDLFEGITDPRGTMTIILATNFFSSA
jgi:FlaG/FlaF family flagellin (archaellin)